MIPLRPQHLRARLTLWCVAVLAAVLLICGVSTSAIMLVELRTQLDRLAIEDLETVEGFLTFGPNGKVSLRNDYHDHPYPTNMQERMLEVWGLEAAAQRASGNDTLLYRNELLGGRALGGPPAPAEGVDSYSERSIRLADGTPVRLVSKRHTLQLSLRMIGARSGAIREQSPRLSMAWSPIASCIRAAGKRCRAARSPADLSFAAGGPGSGRRRHRHNGGATVPFAVTAWPERSFSGTIARASRALDQKTRTMAVELDVMNRDGSLAPGMYPTVKWPVRRSRPSCLVPRPASSHHRTHFRHSQPRRPRRMGGRNEGCHRRRAGRGVRQFEAR